MKSAGSVVLHRSDWICQDLSSLSGQQIKRSTLPVVLCLPDCGDFSPLRGTLTPGDARLRTRSLSDDRIPARLLSLWAVSYIKVSQRETSTKKKEKERPAKSRLISAAQKKNKIKEEEEKHLRLPEAALANCSGASTQ